MGKKGSSLAPKSHPGGSNKTRVPYDSLSMSQWVAGFAQIIREEQNSQTRNYMLEYLCDIMEDSHDFSWQAAKVSHAVLLCKMEENKIDWQKTNKIDRVRRVHAQRAVPTNPKARQANAPPVKILPHVNTFKRWIMKQMVSHISMFVSYVFPKENLTNTLLTTANLVQKTSRALQLCSAENCKI